MTDAEWPMIIKKTEKKRVGYIQVNGLQYIKEINAPISEKTPGEES